MVTNRQKQYAYLMRGKKPEIIIKEEEKMYKEITLDYIETNEEERLANAYDENASIIWEAASEEYIIVYWIETWGGYNITDVIYTGTDCAEEVIESLYRKGYSE